VNFIKPNCICEKKKSPLSLKYPRHHERHFMAHYSSEITILSLKRKTFVLPDESDRVLLFLNEQKKYYNSFLK